MIEHCPLTTMELPAMDPWMDAADGRGDGAADVSGGDAPGGDEPGGVSQAVTAKRTRRGDAPGSDGGSELLAKELLAIWSRRRWSRQQ